MRVTACTSFSIATSTEGTSKAATKIDFFCGVNKRHAGRLVGTAEAHQIPDRIAAAPNSLPCATSGQGGRTQISLHFGAISRHL
jgi:hypothetical protein